MPDNWAYVLAAYGLALVVFGGYWLRLGRRERELTALAVGRGDRVARAGRDTALNGPSAPRAGVPRTQPASRSPRA
jgi:hypothetical protein